MRNPTTQIKTVTRAAAVLPQSTAHALFTISEGRVKLIDIVGEVTVELGAGANNMKLVANPTVGADVDICATADVDTDTVGTLYVISGTLANPMFTSASGAIEAQANPVILVVGTLDLNCDASKAGQIKWTMRYEQLDLGAVVTAA